MGSFSPAGIEYDDPALPAAVGTNGVKAYRRGWNCGIWWALDAPERNPYTIASLQRCYSSGFDAARKAKRERGDTK